MTNASTVPPVFPTPAPRPGREHMFYVITAVLLAITVFVGFGATYFFRLFDGGPRATVTGGPITRLVHLHAVIFTAWVVLYLVQTVLVARHRTAVHMRLGVAGAILAVAMVVVGVRLGIATGAQGLAPSGMDPLAFMVIPLADISMFAFFCAMAIAFRRRPEAHKRLMLLAYVSLLSAAVARLPGVLPLGPPAFYGFPFLFVIAGGIHDRLSRRRIHPVYLWGGTLYIVAVPFRLILSGTAAWRTFAEWLIR